MSNDVLWDIVPMVVHKDRYCTGGSPANAWISLLVQNNTVESEENFPYEP